MKVVLVNLNLVRVPAIAPYAIDVLGTVLERAGHQVDVVDLCRSDDPVDEAINKYFSDNKPDLVGLSMRNAVDMYLPSFFDLQEKGSFLESHRRVVQMIKTYVDTERILIGGAGFSLNPRAFLQRLGLRYGITGPGEVLLSRLASAMGNRGLDQLSDGADGFFLDGGGSGIVGAVSRTYVDNAWYYEYGGQAAIRTSAGCAMSCSYCGEPGALGRSYRRAAVENVLSEIDQLVAVGVRDFQTADSEFNMPLAHSKEVLRAIAERRYKDVRFWAYCQPRPFDEECARLMSAAGFAGVNFGTDHTDPGVLERLGKWYTLADIVQATRFCQEHGIAVMHELLFGGPGDSPAKMYRAIDQLRALDPWVIGVSVGMAVFPDTPLGAYFEQQCGRSRRARGFHCTGESMVDPTFYVEPTFEIPEIYSELHEAVGPGCRNVMLPATESRASTNNQLIDSERVRHQLLVEKRKGPSWYYFPTRTVLTSLEDTR